MPLDFAESLLVLKCYVSKLLQKVVVESVSKTLDN